MSTKQMEAEGGASAVLLEVVTRVPAILLASHYAGLAFQRARLPRISGNLMVGVLAGQHVLGLLTKLVTAKLAVVDNLCLAVIGVAAGAELHIADIRKNPRPTLVMTACVTSFTWVFVFLAFLAVGRQLTFLADLSSAHIVAVASLVATLGVARSPASAIAVMREMDAAGPFCSQVMAVTVVKDVLVIVLFAVNIELIALSGLRFHPHPTTTTIDAAADADAVADPRALDAASSVVVRVLVAFARPALVVASSFAVGAVSGVLVSQLLRPPRSRPALSRVLRPAYVLALSGCLFVAGRRVGLEPLLLCVVAGATAANRRYATAESERETLSAVVGALMPGVNLAFFTLAGASLHLSSVWRSSFAAWAVVWARLFALYHAARAGCDLIGAPAEHREVAWMGYVTQAGVALGLARAAALRFPEWGEDFGAVTVAVVVLNQVIGPPLFRHAILAVGESGVEARRGGAQEGGEV
jgi:NhaP-type Na+/H+ or K+/H+ antiporter